MTLPDLQKLWENLIARDDEGDDGDDGDDDGDDDGGGSAPGQDGNKNGPPGLAGNKKGPPSAPPPPASTSTTSATQVLTTSTAQLPPSTTAISSSTTPSPSPPSPTPSPTNSVAFTTTSISERSSLTLSSIAITSITISPTVYYQTSPISSRSSFVETTSQRTFVSTSSATILPTGLGSFPPNAVITSHHSTLGPGQKAGIAVGTIGGFSFILMLLFLLLKWRRGGLSKAVPSFSRRWIQNCASSPRGQIPGDMSDSLLTPDADSGGSLGWDYRSTFAQSTVTAKSRRSLPRSLRRLARFNPLGQNPVTLDTPAEGSSSRNSFASFFRRHSTASATRIIIDVESPPAVPPLPSGYTPARPPAAALSAWSTESVISSTNDSISVRTMPAQVLPPTFHRSWCYRNSQTTLASVESDARSFKSLPGWVRFHYPYRPPNDKAVLRDSSTPLPAPQALSPGSWLKAKILRRSQSTTASIEKGAGRTASENGSQSESTESPILGPSGWKQTKAERRTSCESADSLAREKQEPWQI